MSSGVMATSVALSGLGFLYECRVISPLEELRNNNQQATARILALAKRQYPEFNVENVFALSDGTLFDYSLRVDLIPKGTDKHTPAHSLICNEN